MSSSPIFANKSVEPPTAEDMKETDIYSRLHALSRSCKNSLQRWQNIFKPKTMWLLHATTTGSEDIAQTRSWLRPPVCSARLGSQRSLDGAVSRAICKKGERGEWGRFHKKGLMSIYSTLTKSSILFFSFGAGGKGGGVLNFNNSSSTILCNEIYGLDCLLFTQDYVLPLLGLEYILITFIDYMQYRLTPDIRSKECVTVPRGLKQLAGYILAFPILQVKMWIEVDEDPLVGAGGRDHPRTTLRGGVRHGVPGRGEVVGIWDPDVASTFVCKTWSHHDLKHVLAHTNRSLIDHILYRN